MIKLILNPYEGVGNIKIGMTKDDISNVLNITPKTFMKSEDEFVDDFKMMHVYYNDQHKSIAFEIFPEIEVKFKGINLTKNKIEIVKKAFEKYDNNIYKSVGSTKVKRAAKGIDTEKYLNNDIIFIIKRSFFLLL